MSTEIKILCRNICYLRQKHKLSKKEMAKIMGIGVSTLSKLEVGILPPKTSVKILFRLCDYFHMNADEFFFSLQREDDSSV